MKKNTTLKKLLKLKFIILFLILAQVAITSFISLNQYQNELQYLENKTNLAKTEYEVIYTKIKEQSAMIFQEQINQAEIINIFKNAYNSNIEEQGSIRKTLYTKLLPSYNRLQKLIGLKQLHFHLPNNHSFLRMHRVDKFGDDLTTVRSTVKYVNEHQKPFDSFEEGRIYNGFRFVYPLFDEQNSHIGSVEVSFSASSFQKALSNDIRFSQFLFSRKIVNQKVWKDEIDENYITSGISPHFFIECDINNPKLIERKKRIRASIKDEHKRVFTKNIKSAKAYSQLINIDGKTVVLSFLPIKNRLDNTLVSYLVIVSRSDYLNNMHVRRFTVNILSLILLLSLFIIIYRHNSHQDDLLVAQIELQEHQKLLMQHSKMAQMGSMLSNIAHQWKQPLARINSKIIEIPTSLELTKRDEQSLNANLEEIEEQTLYMANTLESFRTYFHPNKEKTLFNVKTTIEKAISLLDLDYQNSIKLYTEIDADIKADNYEDELIQVIITLLINAKEALESTPQEHPSIKVILEHKTPNIDIIIMDNAGGVDDKIKDEIFNPYFSTKNSNNNSGTGLYMAQMIVEGNMQGSIKYKKINSQSHFTISIAEVN